MQHIKIGVGLLGCGTVGGGVADVLLRQADHLEKRSGIRLELKKVLVRDMTKPRSIPASLITTRPEDIIDNRDVQVVAELVGGLEPAGEWILRSLKNGKRVVTANKYLLAHRGGEIFSAAADARSCVCFEASCGGAIPIVLALTRGLLANEINAVVGILNGTCNYILSQMTQNNKPYATALAEAQQAGFAEADPHMDVSGLDSGHKLAVLASLAFGADIRPADIDIQGIANLQDVDLSYAKELGYVCKLLAIDDGDKIAAKHPLIRIQFKPHGGGFKRCPTGMIFSRVIPQQRQSTDITARQKFFGSCANGAYATGECHLIHKWFAGHLQRCFIAQFFDGGICRPIGNDNDKFRFGWVFIHNRPICEDVPVPR